ncbi:hypothetical protein MRB53_009595 [Persea americana]|uniref:Uncharacterized protein n=1 Tax=Persea americana TaxID=3435 RepID=A0ACC2LQ52_PERAE|nr:hypothetical protein MRB53_009595 [Persea americana]
MMCSSSACCESNGFLTLDDTQHMDLSLPKPHNDSVPRSNHVHYMWAPGLVDWYYLTLPIRDKRACSILHMRANLNLYSSSALSQYHDKSIESDQLHYIVDFGRLCFGTCPSLLG